MRVHETHIVYTSEIQDAMVRNQTQAKCTDEHPCDVDQAPVCAAIKTGQYEVNGTEYDWDAGATLKRFVEILLT